MNFEEVVALRQSTRKYTDKKVTSEQLEEIIKAANTAPLAAGNRKKVHLTVLHDCALLEEIREFCQMKSIKTPGKIVDPLYGATTLILVSESNVSDDHIEYCDVACIVENMLLAATNLGLGSCYIWGCLKKLRTNKELVEKLKLPEGHELLSGFVCGEATSPLVSKEREPLSITRF